jgi:tripartite-type tricarboxylate transporter receptor subunit TctC
MTFGNMRTVLSKSADITMKLQHRRQFLLLATSVVALPIMSRSAWPLDYPTRPVHIIAGFTPGGGVDITARLIGQWLSERLGQPFVIEDRPGPTATSELRWS